MIICKMYQWIIRKLKPKPKVRVYSDDVRVDYPEGRHIPEWIYEQLWKDIDCSKPVKLDKPMCEDWIDNESITNASSINNGEPTIINERKH